MSDLLMCEAVLLLLKSTCEVFVHGSLESFNKPVHAVLKEGLNETIKLQNELYNKMTEYGWYNVKNVSASTINSSLSKLK